jgi:hypothetical protein
MPLHIGSDATGGPLSSQPIAHDPRHTTACWTRPGYNPSREAALSVQMVPSSTYPRMTAADFQRPWRMMASSAAPWA